MGARRSISNPMVIGWDSLLVPALSFVVTDDHRPLGISETMGTGAIVGSLPWFNEFGFELTGVTTTAGSPPWAVLYGIPLEDDRTILAGSIDRTFDPLFRLMSGADYGDPVTALVEREWPDIVALLRAGQADAFGERTLCRIATSSGEQWVVAYELRRDELDGIGHDRLLDVIQTSLGVALRAASFPTALPGLIEILGGPDRVNRVLDTLAGITGLVADGIGAASDGQLDPKEIYDLLRSGYDLIRERTGRGS